MEAKEISTVAVIGAGTMGAGMAGEFARAGCVVCLMDLEEDILAEGMRRIDAAQEALVGAELLAAAEAQDARRRITTTTCLETACDGVQLLVEAVSEDLSVKKKMFRQFDDLCPAGAVLASNTSGLSITKIARATSRPESVVGMHFWNPPHLIPLVEITKGDGTSDGAANLLMDLARRMGKRPILVKHDVPGFVGNRLQFAVLREALHILSEGIASAEDIDTAMTAGPGLRYGLLGPLRTADLGGLDIFKAISDYLFPELSDAQKPPELMADLVEQGKLGAKSGEGFYSYSEDDLKKILGQRDNVLLGFLKVLRQEER